jgi:hypothetical protein
MGGTPVTDEDRQAVADMHAAGLGRNEIARQLKRSGRTISLIAIDLGLTFDNAEMTQVATKVRQADLAEKRTILAEALIDDALRLTEQMWQPAKIYNFGGKDNEYNERPVDEPPADAKRALMLAAGQAVQRSVQLVPPVHTEGEDDARSVLSRMMTGLVDLYNERQAAGADEGAGDAP